MTLYMGIDPGKDGAIGIVYGNSVIHSFEPMPQTTLDLYHYLKEWQGHVRHIMLEKAQAMPKNGAVSMFNYGVGYGEIRGILTALEIPYTLVTPAKWSKVMCSGVDTRLDAKKRTLVAAQRIFPGESFKKSKRSEKPHSGIYEACLIAEYCRRIIK